LQCASFKATASKAVTHWTSQNDFSSPAGTLRIVRVPGMMLHVVLCCRVYWPVRKEQTGHSFLLAVPLGLGHFNSLGPLLFSFPHSSIWGMVVHYFLALLIQVFCSMLILWVHYFLALLILVYMLFPWPIWGSSLLTGR